MIVVSGAFLVLLIAKAAADFVGGLVAVHAATFSPAVSIIARMSRFRQQVTPAESFTGAGALPDLTHDQKVERDIGSRFRTCGRRIRVSSVCIASAPFGFDALHAREYFLVNIRSE